MKILLIQPPHIGEKTTRKPNVLPLGLGYLASFLSDHGFDVHLFDIWGGVLSKSAVENFLKQNSFDIYGIGALSTQWSYVEWLSGKIKSLYRKPIILGGALATFSYSDVLNNLDVDVCVLGEGEKTLLECAHAFQFNDDLNGVKGIAFLNEGEVFVTEPREYIDNLDDIPFPNCGLFDMDTYLSNCSVYSKYGSYNDLPAINIVTGRGCPYNCNFCSKTFKGARYRTIENVIEELNFLKRSYGIKGVFFNDELVLSSKQRGMELCENIASLDLIWNCQGRINTVDKDLLTCMKEAGCVSVGYGIESGSQRILDLMNKKQTIEQIVDTLNITVDVGIEPIPQWMFGYPGEDDQSVYETKNTLSKINFPMNPSFIFTPLPGTDIFNDALNNGLINDRINYYKNISDGYNHKNPFFVNYTKWSLHKFLIVRRRLEINIFLKLILRSLYTPKIRSVVLKDVIFRLNTIFSKGSAYILRKFFTHLFPKYSNNT